MAVNKAPIHPKVRAAAAGAGAAGVVSTFACWALDAMFWNGDLPPEVPLPVVGMVGLVVGYAISLTAGYLKAPPVDDVDPEQE